MPSGEWRVRIEREFFTDAIRLLLCKPRGDGRVEVLNEDGTFSTVDPEFVGVNIGLPLPVGRQFVEALADACDEFLGNSRPSQAETRLLREWLTVERERTDRLIGRALDADRP